MFATRISDRSFASRLIRALAGVALAATLADCGGGGSDPSPAPGALSYPSPQTYAVGASIAVLSPTVSGTVASYAVAPALPAGLSLDPSNGQVSGLPTAQTAQATYTITASNAAGSSSFALTISVGAAPDFNVGFQVVSYAPGLRAAVWYPTRDAPGVATYPSGMGSDYVLDASQVTALTFPLVIFSHGDGACGTQILFLMETLARKGFIVAAPDHADALCSVDGGPSRGPDPVPAPKFTDDTAWDDTTHVSRRDDVRNLTNWLLATDPFRARLDVQKIGIAGHSLGGYTTLAVGGAWSSWRDGRFKAALAMSPYTLPFLDHDLIPSVAVPVMYQGGTADIGVTPFVAGPVGQYPAGAYSLTATPKYFMNIQGAGHLSWSDLVCPSPGTVNGCLQTVPTAAVMTSYGVAFFRKELQGIDQPLLRTQDPLFATYLFSE